MLYINTKIRSLIKQHHIKLNIIQTQEIINASPKVFAHHPSEFKGVHSLEFKIDELHHQKSSENLN